MRWRALSGGCMFPISLLSLYSPVGQYLRLDVDQTHTRWEVIARYQRLPLSAFFPLQRGACGSLPASSSARFPDVQCGQSHTNYVNELF